MARNSSSCPDTKADRKYSNKYVEFLFHWDTARRLKKPVEGPPEGFQHPGAIHGQRVLRLGKGIPPRDHQEQEFRMHRRRPVPNMSFQSHPDLLCPPRPATADACMHLHLDETRSRSLLSASGQHNASSLKGAGVIVTSEAAPHKPWRGKGAANPSRGLSAEMVQTLSFDPQQQQVQLQKQQQRTQQQQQQRRPLVWSVAPTPRGGVSDVLRHRMSDSARDLTAPKFEVQRPLTPNLVSCSAEERRSAFYGSLKMYAHNKVVGDYGSLRTQSGLRTLAGYAR